MQNRIRPLHVQAKHCTTQSAPIPMPGRLPVTHLVRGLPGQPVHVPTTLDATKTDTMVTATGTITTVRRLEGKTLGRTLIALTADDGNHALVSLDRDVVALTEPALRVGTRVSLHGLTVRQESLPVSIEGLGVRVVTV